MSESRPRWDVLDAGLCACALVALGLAIAPCWAYLNDDAYISFRYAANLLAGDGLTYNPGERVEGYTNFLWVLVTALLLALGGEANIGLLAKSLGAGLAGVCVIATYAAGRRIVSGRAAPAAVAILLAIQPGFAANAVSGLETALFTTLLVLAFLLRLGDSPRHDTGFAGVLALAALTRPEGFYLFGLLAALQWVAGIPLRRIARVAFVFAAVTGPYLVWKLVYYGALLPNTFHAKPGTVGAGLRYAADFLSGAGWTSPLGLPLVMVAAGLACARAGSRLWLGGFLAAIASAIVLSGGDWMLGWRFCVPALPFLALAVGVALSRLEVLLAARGAALAASVPIAVAIAVGGGLLAPRHAIATACRERAEGQREAHEFVTRHLVAHAAPGDSIALMDIGMIGFHSRLRVIDITGLTDAHIAAAPGPMLQKRYDPGYVLEQEPAWIVLVGRAPALPRRTAEATLAGRSFALDPEALWFQDRQLARHPRFARDYEFVLSRHARHEGWLHLFRRR